MAENQAKGEKEVQKSDVAKREEEILKFWRENKIFEKSLTKESPKGEYTFYDGPPFATGLPHYGHILASAIKDAVPRFWTMKGYRVPRRWGWDCHGLPIENIIEQKLGLKNKKEIERIGIGKFNAEARAAVLKYAAEWKKTIERIGRWVDFDGSYKTMDNSYIESVWWALAEMHQKGLVYEGTRVLTYCPRCETPMAQSEIAMDNSYKTVTDRAVTVKFKVKEPEKHDLPPGTYILAWTTTPWTLPGNVALAVGKDIEYVLVEKNGEWLVLARKLAELAPSEPAPGGVASREARPISAKTLIGLEYEPLFEIPAVKKTGKKSWRVVPGDFVTTEDGTGVVHTAVIHGEDDYKLGLEHNLPMVPLIDARGHFNLEAPEFLRGQYFKKADKLIIDDLTARGLIFKAEDYTHSYPHCYRCGTPIIYYALPAWFVNVQKIKKKVLKLNQKINWSPAHLKDGRFKNIVEGAPDWNISRSRYWASPLPIWKCGECGQTELIGSLAGLKERLGGSHNAYYLMRHALAECNVNQESSAHLENPVSSRVNNNHHLTPTGQNQIAESIPKLKKFKIDLIFSSEFIRAKETAQQIAAALGLDQGQVIYDPRLNEADAGEFEGKTWAEHHAYFTDTREMYYKPAPGGESFRAVRLRVANLVFEIEKKYRGRNILVVSHGYPLYALEKSMLGITDEEYANILGERQELRNAEIKPVDFWLFPHNKDYELDLHRPYIDAIKLKCPCGGEMSRVPEVFDCWFESGAMSFAAVHYPFANPDWLKEHFPADFVAEYIAQTRTWFYYMLVVSTILFKDAPFKNVVTTGTILAEDGEKMSKSKGNFPDPWLVFDRYGVDALRFYLLSTPVMKAEDLNFSEKGLAEVFKKDILRLKNVLSFYQMYVKGETPEIPIGLTPATEHVLDRWILFRLTELQEEVTGAMESYQLGQAFEPIEHFIDDLSTWYLRRSRERLRAAPQAAGTLRQVLIELAKILAPFTPFVAEEIYLALKSKSDPASVHLCDWPQGGELSDSSYQLLASMVEARGVVSLGLEARARAGIKIRQPLSLLKIRKEKDFPPELSAIIAEELNVKKVEAIKDLTETVWLDTTLTVELREEGLVRDLIRSFQVARREAGLEPGRPVRSKLTAPADTLLLAQKHEPLIKSVASLSHIDYREGDWEIKL